MWVIFALLNPDLDSEYGSGSTNLTESGSKTLINIIRITKNGREVILKVLYLVRSTVVWNVSTVRQVWNDTGTTEPYGKNHQNGCKVILQVLGEIHSDVEGLDSEAGVERYRYY
jgi:hypothetical protein